MKTEIQSSYRDSGYGRLFYALAYLHKPGLVVELGTYQGYSGLHIASALAEDSSSFSELYMIDLWEDYPYSHCSLQTTKENFRKNGLLSHDHLVCRFLQQDVMEAHQVFADNSIDMLHLDISNEGESLEICLDHWHDKLRNEAIVLFEGGSKERYEIDWTQNLQETARPAII